MTLPMRPLSPLFVLLLAVAPSFADEAVKAEEPSPIGAEIAADLMPNGKAPLPGIATGGEPSQAQLEAIAANGFRTVVNLRTDGEPSEIGEDDVRSLGMRYVSIPVAGAADLTEEKVRALDAVLDDPEAYPVAVYCGSGNRVGALLTLRAAWLEEATPEEALALGRDAGLTRLEPAVKEKLGVE